MSAQVIDLRSRVPACVGGDVKVHLKEVAVMRADMAIGEHRVAPGCTVAVRGGIATAGTAITADSLPDGEGPAWWRLQALVRDGRVLERY